MVNQNTNTDIDILRHSSTVQDIGQRFQPFSVEAANEKAASEDPSEFISLVK